MTVAAVVRKAGPTPGNGVATAFPFVFKVFADSDVSVVKTVIATGAQTTLVLNDPLGYTIARNPDQNSTPGGTITYNPSGVPLPATESLTIISVVPQVQGTHITNGGAFFANNIEDAIDKVLVNVQDLSSQVSSAVRFPAVDSAALSAILPAAALRANAYLFFDGSGNVGVTPGSGASTPVSVAMAPVVAAATIALGRIALGLNVQDIWAGTAGGTANALTLTPTPALEAYAVGQRVWFKSSATPNNAATTLAVSGQAAIAMQSNGAAMVGGEIEASRWYTALFDGLTFQVSPVSPAVLLSLFTTKGDIPVATAAGKIVRKAAGAEGSFLQADPAQTDGLVYVKLGAGDVRQSVLACALDANGLANAITTGAGLRPSLDANPTAMTLTFAAGCGAGGALDLVANLTADVVDPLGADLKLNNTNYIHATWATLTTVTWGQTLVPPQYGLAYDRTKLAVLQFAGAPGATTFLDDGGMTWTAVGGAKVQTNSFKFGTGGLGGAGAGNALNGAADAIKTTDFTLFPDGSWAMRGWANPSSLPGAGNTVAIMAGTNGAGFGAMLGISNVAGTIRFSYHLSSDGASWNIATAVSGTTLPVVGTYYYVELTYDFKAATYRLYVNGAQEASTASPARVGLVVGLGVGLNPGPASGWFNGYIDKPEFRGTCDHPNGTAYAAPTGVPSVNDLQVNFFSVSEMKMYEVTGASVAAGTNPTLTAKNRVFVAEADTSGVAVTAVRNYAVRGQYMGTPTVYTGTSRTAFSHNVGVPPEWVDFDVNFKNVLADNGWFTGDTWKFSSIEDNAASACVNSVEGRCTAAFSTFNGMPVGVTKSVSGRLGLTPANWKITAKARRNF